MEKRILEDREVIRNLIIDNDVIIVGRGVVLDGCDIRGDLILCETAHQAVVTHNFIRGSLHVNMKLEEYNISDNKIDGILFEREGGPRVVTLKEFEESLIESHDRFDDLIIIGEGNDKN